MYDLSKLYINFTKCPKGIKLCEHHAELSAFSEFTSTKNENIIKVAILTADMESPFLKIKDRKTMIRTIFEFLGLSLDGKPTKQLYNEIVEYKETHYLDCFGRYLMILHDIDWTEYQSTKQTHDVLTMDSMRPREKEENIDAFVKRRVNIQTHLKKIGDDLKKLEAKIFPDSRSAREVVLNEVRKIVSYPEKYAVERQVI